MNDDMQRAMLDDPRSPYYRRPKARIEAVNFAPLVSIEHWMEPEPGIMGSFTIHVVHATLKPHPASHPDTWLHYRQHLPAEVVRSASIDIVTETKRRAAAIVFRSFIERMIS